MSETLIRSDRGPVRVLTLNRPGARNALSRDLIRALYAALKESDLDEAVGAVVLTGADPAFCAGLDLKEAARDGMDYFAEFQTNNCIAAVARCARRSLGRSMERHSPAVSRLHSLRLSRRIRMCSLRRYPRRVGILPGGGMTARLPQVRRRCDGASVVHDR